MGGGGAVDMSDSWDWGGGGGVGGSEEAGGCRFVAVVSLLLCRRVVVSLGRWVVGSLCVLTRLFLLLLFLGVFEGGGVVGGGSEVGAFCVCGVVVAEGCGG